MKLTVPVIGILRGVDAGFFRSIMDASFASGLQALEVTMNTENAAQIVAACRASVPEGRLLGMGTVRNIKEAHQAADAGAMFLVTPNTDPAVIEFARSRDIPVIAGALTPTEVYTAWAAGANMVKIFPCRPFGPEYIRELRGPYDEIPLVAVGGVGKENVGEYFSAGANAVGVGTSLFGRSALAGRDPEKISGHVAEFLALCPRHKE